MQYELEEYDSHKLLMLKHEHTIWLLRQDELIAKDKEGRLRMQDITLAQKRLNTISR